MKLLLMIILSIVTLFLLFINSLFYIEYLNELDDKEINFRNCSYWENAQIPKISSDFHKWKIITTIGECKIYSKQPYIEQYINYNVLFPYNLNYSGLKYKAAYIKDQAKMYLKDLKDKK